MVSTNPFVSETAIREEQLRTGQTTIRGEEVGGEVIKSRQEIEEEAAREVRRRRTSRARETVSVPESVSVVVKQPTQPSPTVKPRVTPIPISERIVQSQLEAARLAAQRDVKVDTLTAPERESPLKSLQRLGGTRGRIEQRQFETGTPISVVETITETEESGETTREKFLKQTGQNAKLIEREVTKGTRAFVEAEPLIGTPFEAITGKKVPGTQAAEKVLKGAARGVAGVAKTVIEEPGTAAGIAGVATGVGAALTLLPEPITTAAGVALLTVVGATEGVRIATAEDPLIATGESGARISTTALLLSPFVKLGGTAAKFGREALFPQTPIEVTGRGFEFPKQGGRDVLTERLTAKQLVKLSKQPAQARFAEQIETTKLVTEARGFAEARSTNFFGRPDFQPSATVTRQVTELQFPTQQQFKVTGIITEKGFQPFREFKPPSIVGKKAEIDIGVSDLFIGTADAGVKTRPSSLFGFAGGLFEAPALSTPSLFVGVPVPPTRPKGRADITKFELGRLGDVRGIPIAKQLESARVKIEPVISPLPSPQPDITSIGLVDPGVEAPSISDTTALFQESAQEQQAISIPSVPIPALAKAPIGGIPPLLLFGGGGLGVPRARKVRKTKKRPTKSITQSIFGVEGVGFTQKGISEITGLTLRE